MPKIDLLNCPFCGGKAEIISMSEKFTVSCGTGGCMANISYCSDKQSAVKAWNNRASGWIPCSERLPNNAERCIVFMYDGNIQFGWWNALYYDGGVWCVLYPGKPAKLFRIKNVPYWMPLPEPPGGDNNA